MITPLDQPMDPLDNMTVDEQIALDEWEERFKVILKVLGYSNDVQIKYTVVGALVEPDQKPSEKM